MATTIITKYGSGAPAASDVVRGELAVDTENGRLYTETSGGAVIEIGLNPSGNVDVTGTVTADGLIVESQTGITLEDAGDSRIGKLFFDAGAFQQQATGSGDIIHYTTDSKTERHRISSNGDISFYEDTGTTAKFFWDASAESLGIGTSSPEALLSLSKTTAGGEGGYIYIDNPAASTLDSKSGIKFGTSSGASFASVPTGEITNVVTDAGSGASALTFGTFNGTASGERMRIDSSGNLLVGATTATNLSDGTGNDGVQLNPSGTVAAARTSNVTAVFNRLSTDGEIVRFNKDGTAVGSIGSADKSSVSRLMIGTGETNLYFFDTNNTIYPVNSNGTDSDADTDLGASGARFKDLYRSGSTISTSDRNMKQDERDLTEAETRVAQACKGLLKAFRFIDAVEVDGDDARIHFGIIAQDLQAAFEAEGLDATKYAMFRPSTFTDDEGNEQVRLGVCYENLLAFIIAAI